MCGAPEGCPCRKFVEASPVTSPKRCAGCGKWFEPIPEMQNVSCCVMHPPGTCCHYTEREVDAPVPASPKRFAEMTDAMLVREMYAMGILALRDAIRAEAITDMQPMVDMLREDCDAATTRAERAERERDEAQKEMHDWRLQAIDERKALRTAESALGEARREGAREALEDAIHDSQLDARADLPVMAPVEARLDALIAAVRAEERARLEQMAALAKREHYYCEDSFYSCPKAPEGCANDAEGDDCVCGAEKHNAAVDALLSEREGA